MTEGKIQWHPAFYAALQIELEKEQEMLQFEEEYLLGKKPMQIDVVGDAFPMQLIINGRLSKKQNYWLQNLRTDLKSGGEIRALVEAYEPKKKSELYQAVMDVVLRANWKETEAERNMCEALRELFAEELRESEEKGLRQGLEQGEIRGIELTKKIFQLSIRNFSISQIAAECKITEEKVKEILE